jgi:hypothetical protein
MGAASTQALCRRLKLRLGRVQVRMIRLPRGRVVSPCSLTSTALKLRGASGAALTRLPAQRLVHGQVLKQCLAAHLAKDEERCSQKTVLQDKREAGACASYC